MSSIDDRHFLGRGFAFPPNFAGGQICMVEDEADIRQSLQILFGTLPGERLLQPQFGLDMTPLLFEPISTTLRTLLLDRITTTLLIHEPRIRVLELHIDDSEALQGMLQIRLAYSVRSSNSRFNLARQSVLPFNAIGVIRVHRPQQAPELGGDRLPRQPTCRSGQIVRLGQQRLLPRLGGQQGLELVWGVVEGGHFCEIFSTRKSLSYLDLLEHLRTSLRS